MNSTIKVLTLAFCFVAMSGVTWGQTTNDFRTHQSGGWHDAATWEKFNGLFWEWPSQAPSSADNVIRILTGHTVSISGLDVTADQLTVDGTLNVNSGRVLTIADGPGIDLITNLSSASVLIDGTLINNGTIQINLGAFSIGTLINNGVFEIGGIFNFNQGNITGNDLRYGPTGSAVINFPGYTVDQDNHLWPSTNGPANVTVTGGLTLNSARTVSGSFQSSGTLQLNDTLTTNGTTLLGGILQGAAPLRNNGSLQVPGTLQLAGTLTNNGTVQVFGTLQINQGGTAIGNDFGYSGCCSGLVLNGSYSINSGTAFWPSTNGPANVTVQGSVNVTLNVARTVSGSLDVSGTLQVADTLTNNGTTHVLFSGTLQVAGTLINNGTVQVDGTLQVTGTVRNNVTVQVGGTLQVTGTFTNNGTTQIYGTFQLDQGGSADGSDFTYVFNGTLVFNNSSGSYGVDSGDVYWPSASGPAYVIVQGAGGITMNVARAVSDLFQTAAGVTNGSNLTLPGTVQINAGGFFDSSPIYSGNARLIYYTGGTYNVGPEWGSGTNVGQGVPMSIDIWNNTTVNMPGTPRTCPGNLSIGGYQTSETGTLVMNTTPGADLSVGGNWQNGYTGTFIPNSRTVIFDGAAEQDIEGLTTFDYLTVNNPAGISLSKGTEETDDDSITVNQMLTFTAGNIRLANGSFLILSGSVSGPSLTRHVVTYGGGFVIRCMSGGASFQFPVSPTETSYNPLTIALDPADPTETFSVHVDSTVSISAPDDSLFVQRTWDIAEGSQGGNHAALTFQWAGAEEGARFTRDSSSTYHDNVELVRNTGASGTDPYIVSTTGGFPCTEFSSFVVGTPGALTTVEESENGIPISFSLHQNYPNPFNPSTVIRFEVPSSRIVSLKVYNLLGQEAATLVDEEMKPGTYEVTWDAAGLASGVYFYRLQASNFLQTRKLLLLR